jgi:L-2-hydroxyglutarate oxidase LhgO
LNNVKLAATFTNDDLRVLLMDQIESVVIGAGVIGLAVARALALSGREVLVIEAADAIGTKTSSRNSEVIHAGIYYPAGSLKAQLCVQGRQMLYAYCAERGVGHKRCGKLIVAISAQQVAQLQSIAQKARINGVSDLMFLSRQQALELEPALQCEASLLSPSTGIVDSHALMLSMQGDLENASGLVALNSPVERAQVSANRFIVQTKDGTQIQSRYLINAAGLNATDLARRMDGLDHSLVPPIFFAKGNYFTLAGRSPFSRLIYPVPESAGLGVHLTVDLGGQAKFGPDVEWVDSAEQLEVDPKRSELFYAEIRKYWPALQDGSLQPGYAGMRPKIHAPHEAARDFLIQGPQQHGISGLVNLFGLESPGLTSSLAIGEMVSKQLAS